MSIETKNIVKIFKYLIWDRNIINLSHWNVKKRIVSCLILKVHGETQV